MSYKTYITFIIDKQFVHYSLSMEALMVGIIKVTFQKITYCVWTV